LAEISEIVDCIRKVVAPSKHMDFRLGSTSSLAGILDSFQRVLLVTTIEDKFKIDFEQADLVEDRNWNSPEAITELVNRIKSRSS
jgi:acyl carrier protein